jgi:Zn-dependent protease
VTPSPYEPAPAPNRPQASPPPASSPKSGIAAVLAAVGLGFAKFGKAIFAFLKFGSLGKLALSSLSMLAMVWYEAVRYGVWYGVGFVFLLLIHELGHGYAIKAAGLEAGWPIFIPGFGAMINLRGAVPDADTEARIAYAGPLAGLFASLVCAALYFATHSRLYLALASTGFLLNLFNLVPLSPLDGGRVAQAFSRKAWIFGLVLFVGLFFVTKAPIMPIMLIFALPRILAGDAGAHPELTEEQKSAWINRYFALCVFLALGFWFTSRMLGRSF